MCVYAGTDDVAQCVVVTLLAPAVDVQCLGGEAHLLVGRLPVGDGVQDVAEARALRATLLLGDVLLAVGGQLAQLIAQLAYVQTFEVLQASKQLTIT